MINEFRRNTEDIGEHLGMTLRFSRQSEVAHTNKEQPNAINTTLMSVRNTVGTYLSQIRSTWLMITHEPAIY